MAESRKTKMIEARTIIYLLYGITADSGKWGEFLPREEIMHLLKMARKRLDDLEKCISADRRLGDGG